MFSSNMIPNQPVASKHLTAVFTAYNLLDLRLNPFWQWSHENGFSKWPE